MVSFRRHAWWKPHTRLEKLLLILFIGFLLVTLILSIVLMYIYWTGVTKYVCESRGCVLAASSILNNINFSADPCNDFYEFACGNFEDTVVLAEEESAINSFNLIDKTIQAKMREFIQLPWKEPEPHYYKLVKDLYSSCMNSSIIEELGSKPLLTEMERVGGWPVLTGSAWNADNFEWTDTVFKFRQMGVFMNVLMDVSVVQDLKNSSKFVIQIDQPILGMPDRSYLVKGFDDSLVQAYYRYMVETAVLLGATDTVAKDELKEALEFEIKLAEISLPKEELRNYTKMYNKMTPKELGELMPQVNWTNFFNNLQLPKTVDETEEIIVITPSFVSNFSSLINSTDKKVIANYMFWRMAKSLTDALDRRFEILRMRYNRYLTGQASQIARAYYCSETVFDNLDIAIGAIYVRNFFNTKSKEIASEIVKEVKQVFYKSFDSVEWLDEETLKKAKEKMKAMQDYVAYPDELLNTTKVNDFHSRLSIRQDEYFHNVLRLNKFSTDFYLSRLTQTAEETQWINVGTAAVVNAFYKFSDNIMVFYAAILNGAFFNADFPKYMNFGSLGFIVGHEISHGFDDMGRQYDAQGNLESWWTPETDKQFSEKAKCIIEQYGNYTVPEIDMKVNGINTQGENIADVCGGKMAFKAYNEWIKKHGEELPLPGLNFNSRQLFWLSNANVWCSKSRDEYLRLQVNTDFHSPSRFRVNGPYSDSPEFARDFNCPIGSPMNPVKKCSVW